MVIEPHLEDKYVILWESHADQTDMQAQATIKKIIIENHKNKIKTVIFQSGNKSLPEHIADFYELYSKKQTYSKETDYKTVELFIKMWYNIFAKQNRQ